MAFNPSYEPSGSNNKINPYRKKINHVRIAKNQSTKLELNGAGGSTPVDPIVPFPIPSDVVWSSTYTMTPLYADVSGGFYGFRYQEPPGPYSASEIEPVAYFDVLIDELSYTNGANLLFTLSFGAESNTARPVQTAVLYLDIDGTELILELDGSTFAEAYTVRAFTAPDQAAVLQAAADKLVAAVGSTIPIRIGYSPSDNPVIPEAITWTDFTFTPADHVSDPDEVGYDYAQTWFPGGNLNGINYLGSQVDIVAILDDEINFVFDGVPTANPGGNTIVYLAMGPAYGLPLTVQNNRYRAYAADYGIVADLNGYIDADIGNAIPMKLGFRSTDPATQIMPLPKLSGTFSPDGVSTSKVLTLEGVPSPEEFFINLTGIVINGIAIADQSIPFPGGLTADQVADEIAAHMNGIEDGTGAAHIHAVANTNKVTFTDDTGQNYDASPTFSIIQKL